MLLSPHRTSIDVPGDHRIRETDAQAFIRETCHVVPAHDLVPAAYDLACNLGITIYDALFVAAAVRCGTRLVTGDARLYEAAKRAVAAELVR